MVEVGHPFAEEIGANRSAESAPDYRIKLVENNTVLEIRLRGLFIIDCQLTEPVSGNKVSVLHSDPDLKTPKLTASHVMSPVGPSEGLGGQHGYPRWADYHHFMPIEGHNGGIALAFQAKRSDDGLGLAKTFELVNSALTSQTTVMNPGPAAARTSIGEHYYFALADEQTKGLSVNGQPLDELLGEGAEEDIMAGGFRFWPEFGGEAIISFPAGHNVKLSAGFSGDADLGLGMLVWHKPDSPSICFEPTVGVGIDRQNDGLVVPAYGRAALTTAIELVDMADFGSGNRVIRSV